MKNMTYKELALEFEKRLIKSPLIGKGKIYKYGSLKKSDFKEYYLGANQYITFEFLLALVGVELLEVQSKEEFMAKCSLALGINNEIVKFLLNRIYQTHYSRGRLKKFCVDINKINEMIENAFEEEKKYIFGNYERKIKSLRRKVEYKIRSEAIRRYEIAEEKAREYKKIMSKYTEYMSMIVNFIREMGYRDGNIDNRFIREVL
jgi:hypothetical protein